MNASAILSSSAVEMPGRTAFRRVSTVAAKRRPPSAIISILRVDDVEGDHAVDFAPQSGEHVAKPLGLWDGAYHAIENGTLGVERHAQRFADDPEDHGVGHQIAAVHVGLRLEAELGAVLDGVSKDVPRGQRGATKRFGEPRSLSPFSCTWLTEKDDFHGEPRWSSQACSTRTRGTTTD